MKPKIVIRRILAVIVSMCLSMTWSASALAAVAQASEPAGSFTLIAVGEDDIFISPEEVPYESGQTVLEALQATSHSFVVDPSSGFLTSVDGHSDGFTVYLQDGSYSLSQPASAATALLIREVDGVTDQTFDSYLGSLVAAMGVYAQSTDGLKNYTAAKKAYANAVKDLYYANTTSGSTAQSLCEALTNAIDAWNALQGGVRRTVSFAATSAGATVSDATIEVADEWGNVQDVTSCAASLLEGSTYSYTIKYGDNAVSGAVEVTSQTTSVTAELPSGSWFGNVTLFNAKGDLSSAFSQEGDVFLVPDYVIDDTDAGVYAYVEDGSDCPSSATLSVSYTDASAAFVSSSIAWKSTASKLARLLSRGLAGNSFTLVATCKKSDGTSQTQSRRVDISRLGSLTGLSLKDAAGAEQLVGFDAGTHAYQVMCADTTLQCTLQADASYTLAVDGDCVLAGAPVTLSATPEGTTHQITVTASGRVNIYTVTLTKKDTVTLTLNHAADVDVELCNAAGGMLAPASTSSIQAMYEVVPGCTYTYVATYQDVYHARKEFTVNEATSLDVTTPAAGNWVKNIELYAGTGTKALAYDHVDGWTFDSANHSYSWIVGDTDTATAISITSTEEASEAGVTAQVSWSSQKTGALCTNRLQAATLLAGGKANLGMFHRKGTVGNSATVVLTSAQTTGAGETCYQDFALSYVVQASLGDLTVSCDGDEMTLTPVGADEDAENLFDRDIHEYKVVVSENATSANVSFAFPAGSDSDDLVYGTYALSFNGESLAYTTETVTRVVDLEEGDTEVAITVSGTTDTGTLPACYKVRIVHAVNVPVKMVTDPVDASVTLIQVNNNERIWPDEDGTYTLMEAFSYRYTVACEGYVGTGGNFTAENGMDNLKVTLTVAPESPALDTSIEAAWPYFRADENNNGVVDYSTPTTSDDASLYWATKLGDGYSSGATGCPILVDGYLYTYANTHIYKVDTVSGEVVAVGDMVASSSFAINSPAYADGMIFVGLSKGRVQAFNAKTLESMWVYTDALGGQPNCPITYKSGRVYTGFWNSETKQANFVCLTTTDEDPSSTTESKIPLWTHADNGFYWAGAYASDDFVLVGTDDGDSGYLTNGGKMLSLDARTGKLISSVNGLAGDVRSSVCYDNATNRYYFTSKGGYFYGMSVDSKGVIDSDSFTALHLYNYADSATQPPMSTCTPCVYNGRAYIGVSGTGQFTSYSGHNITVIDLATNRIAYTVRTQGYPQTSGLVTTAYDEGDGTVYVYFFDNYTPGVLRVLKDKPGQTAANATVVETAPDGTTYACAQVLFTPSGAQAQYAICSPVVDDYGTIYFKNDSAYMMAVGPKITKIEVTKQPNKRTYEVGETFDATGMQVTATYSNGKTRDVTNYVTVDTTTPLTADDTDIEVSFDYVMYHDQSGKAATLLEHPSTSVSVSIAGGSSAKQSLAGKKVKLSANTLTWTGKALKPTVTVAGLKAGTDFTVSYSSNVKCGKATVTVTGKGSYTGALKTAFTIVPKKAAAPKLKAGKKRITVSKWAATGATSYLVQMRVKGGKWVTKKKLSAPKKITVKKLKSSKKYQVRIVSVSSVKKVTGKASAFKKAK